MSETKHKVIYIDYGHNPKSGLTIATGSAKTGIDWEQIGNIKTEANAKRIMHCVNHFDKVVEALNNLLQQSRIGTIENQISAREQANEALKNAQQK